MFCVNRKCPKSFFRGHIKTMMFSNNKKKRKKNIEELFFLYTAMLLSKWVLQPQDCPVLLSFSYIYWVNTSKCNSWDSEFTSAFTAEGAGPRRVVSKQLANPLYEYWKNPRQKVIKFNFSAKFCLHICINPRDISSETVLTVPTGQRHVKYFGGLWEDVTRWLPLPRKSFFSPV